MLKMMISLLWVTMLLSCTSQAHELSAEDLIVTKIAIHIQSQDYTHPIKLWRYSEDSWVTQGPLLESAADKVLNAEFGVGNALMCDAKPSVSNVLVWLRPRMFYNPQIQRYYGKVIAAVYTADGKPLANYVGQAQKQGVLGHYQELALADVYQSAMKAVATKMKADSKFQAALNGKTSENPCAIVNLLPEPKIQFMSF
jgi:hypothetical protein